MNHYSMLIAWSNEDQAYIVSFPEWEAAGNIAHTYGATYAEAIKAGEDMLAFLIDAQQASGEPLPAPRLFASAHP